MLVGLTLSVGLIYLMVKPMDKYSFIIGVLVLAGGSGNLYDRVFNDGRVVDFIYLQIGPFHSEVFNVANMA